VNAAKYLENINEICTWVATVVETQKMKINYKTYCKVFLTESDEIGKIYELAVEYKMCESSLIWCEK
jgi:hypothetical protein